jgi:hypothetical protein
MDPPYMSKSQSYCKYKAKFSLSDYIYFLDLLKSDCKCKLIFNFDFNGFIYNNYQKYIQEVYEKKYNRGHIIRKTIPAYQCFLTN